MRSGDSSLGGDWDIIGASRGWVRDVELVSRGG